MPNQVDAGNIKFRVLLVEEDIELARIVLANLAKAGMQCYHAAEPQVGFESFQKNDPHLVLLSLGLPRVGGAVLCPRIRALSTVPIVVLSIRTRKEDQLHALNIGADDFIYMRPFDEQILMARVLTLLRRVYRYDQQQEEENIDIEVTQSTSTQTTLPTDWVTCNPVVIWGQVTVLKRWMQREIGP